MKKIFIKIIFALSLLIPSISFAQIGIQVQFTNPISGSSITSPVSIDGRNFLGGPGSWGCSVDFLWLVYQYDNPSVWPGPGSPGTVEGSDRGIVRLPRFPFLTWNNFSQSDVLPLLPHTPPASLPPGVHTLYWRLVGGAVPLMSSGPICYTPVQSITFRVVDPSQVPSVSFLLNGAPQNISLNTPQETFSYRVSASLNAERCYVFSENNYGSSGNWQETSCNQNFSNISLEGIGNGSTPFSLGPIMEGENRFFVRAWNSLGGYSPTVERRITSSAGLPQVVLWNDPPIYGWEETTNINWSVDNADSCTTSSSPSQLWWNGVTVPIFAGWSNNSFSPVLTPPVVETYELTMTCSNSVGSAIARLNIAPQIPGYCGDGYVYRFGAIPEQCDLGPLNGDIGSGCSNSCQVVPNLDFTLSADQAIVNYPNSVTIRSRLIESGLPLTNILSCVARNIPQNNAFWNGAISINKTGDTVRTGSLNPGVHDVSLECDNGYETITKNLQIIVVASENGQCGIDNAGTFTSTPTNLCISGTANPVPPSYSALTNRWTWQCEPTGFSTITRSCFANMAQAPQVWSVDIRNQSNTVVVSEISADGSTEYNVNIYANENSGGTNLTSLYTAVNYDGTIHAPAYRGFLGWSNENFPGWGGGFSEGPIACSGGGFGAIRSLYGSEYMNLISCSISTSGSSRTATFRISFNNNFVSPVSGNILSGFARSSTGLESPWTPSGNFNLLGSMPAVNGQCGSADGKKRFTKPAGSVLCNAGNPTTVSGSGPWAWTCRGTGPGSSDSRICRADKWRIGFEEN